MGVQVLRSGAVGVALLMSLSACETPTSSATDTAASRAEFRAELPPELYDFAFSAAVAEQIAGECRAISFNRPEAQAQMKSLDAELKAEGYQESDIRYLADAIPPKRAQDDLIKYIQQSGVVVGEPDTFCAAGQREIANGTRIGAFLKG